MSNNAIALPPLALYIHIPWCVRKCPYCDFNSHKAEPTLPEADYVAALIEDLKVDAALCRDRQLSSIFIGGGTPSLFSAASIGQILDAAADIVGFEDDIEITLEANPGTFEQEKFSAFRACGVNRLSIGVQSFNDVQLKILGRIHSSGEAKAAIEMARKAGFDNINIDLMHGLPEQSLQQGLDDLRQAIALKPEHLSWYQLTIEQNTEFYSAPPPLPVDDTLADIQEQGHKLLLDAGFTQYEVSAYTQANKNSRHNLNYWRFGDYLGIGAGAHGKITHIEGERLRIERRHKTRQPQHYLDYQQRVTGFVAGQQQIDAEQLPLEFIMNALRLCDGVSMNRFRETTGLCASSLEPQRQQLINRKLLLDDPERLQTTELGQRFLNEVLSVYME